MALAIILVTILQVLLVLALVWILIRALRTGQNWKEIAVQSYTAIILALFAIIVLGGILIRLIPKL